MSTDYEYVGQTSLSPNDSENDILNQEPAEEPVEQPHPYSEPPEPSSDGTTTEENSGGQRSQVPFVLLRSEGNALGGFDIVVPWLPEALFRSKTKKEKPEVTVRADSAFAEIGKRSLRVLSAAMAAHYYLQKEPALSMASVGTQVKELALPIFVAYTAGVYLAPIGAVMYGLAGLKLLNKA
jgi:hypothetical protein